MLMSGSLGGNWPSYEYLREYNEAVRNQQWHPMHEESEIMQNNIDACLNKYFREHNKCPDVVRDYLKEHGKIIQIEKKDNSGKDYHFDIDVKKENDKSDFIISLRITPKI